MQVNSVAKVTTDAVAAGSILGSILGYLPAIAAIAAIIWYAVQIWESKTVQSQVRVWRRRKRARRIADLRRVLEAQGKLVVILPPPPKELGKADGALPE